MNFLQDKSFLLKLNRHKIKNYYASIMVLDFETENPIAKLEGKIISGGLNATANSPTRKTGSFQIILDKDTYSITEIKNLIAIDKKISFSIGIKNPFYHTTQYKKYGEDLWFKQGIFFITSASASINSNGKTITMNLIDKMGGLNGVCGGTLPASTSFHDKIIISDNGDQTIEYPIIKDIIFEAVTHFGNEHPSRVIIEDIPEVGTQILQYNGSTPLKFYPKGQSGYSRQFVIEEPIEAENMEIYYKGNFVGYRETPLTYPGELIQKAGSTVTALLDELVKTLGNFEYFYDEEGNFHFRKIRNYQATSNTPLNYNSTIVTEVIDEQSHRSVKEISMDSELQNLYLPRYSNYQFLNEFADSSLISQVSFQPKWDNIKNDFICWGTKNSSTNTLSMVRYHLAIDERPADIRVNLNEKDTNKVISLCHQKIWVIKDINNSKILRYQTNELVNAGEIAELLCDSLDSIFKDLPDRYWFNWREELYRKALIAYGTSTKGSEYDEELLAEWRNLYDPMNKDFKNDWELQFGVSSADNPNSWTGYCVNVKIAPSKLKYWLDIIDTNSPIGRFSIKKIGKRTKVQENSKINEIFDAEIPSIVFLRNDGDIVAMQKASEYYIQRGQDYTFITDEMARNFSLRNSFGTCYDDIRSMLNSNLLFNTSVSITSIPIFYLTVNSVIHLGLKEYNIAGDYVINTIGWQINSKGGTMTLQLNEAITII